MSILAAALHVDDATDRRSRSTCLEDLGRPYGRYAGGLDAVVRTKPSTDVVNVGCRRAQGDESDPVTETLHPRTENLEGSSSLLVQDVNLINEKKLKATEQFGFLLLVLPANTNEDRDENIRAEKDQIFWIAPRRV